MMHDVTTHHHRRLHRGRRRASAHSRPRYRLDSIRLDVVPLPRAVDARRARRTSRIHSIDLHARGDSTRARRGNSRAVVVDARVSREIQRRETDDDSIVDRTERGLDRDERDVGEGEVGRDARGV